MRSHTSTTHTKAALSDVPVSLTLPESLAAKLRQLSDLECSTIAGTTRRLIARAIDRELAGLAAGVR